MATESCTTFLTLPPEIRLIIYEYTPDIPDHRPVKLYTGEASFETVTAVTTALASNIRLVCRLVASEAWFLVRPAIENASTLNQTYGLLSRLILRPEQLPSLSNKHGFLALVCRRHEALRDERILWSKFIRMEGVDDLEKDLLFLIRTAGLLMRRNPDTHNKFHVAVQPDPLGDIHSFNDFIKYFKSSGGLDSLTSMAKDHDLLFVVNFLPLKDRKFRPAVYHLRGHQRVEICSKRIWDWV